MLTLFEETRSTMLWLQSVYSKVVFLGGLVVMLVFVGAGCSLKSEPVLNGRGGQRPEAEASAFSGLDGSLTELAFDAVAESFSSYLLEEPVTEYPDQNVFAEWIALQSDIPVNDTFENPLKLRSSEARVYTLWTEGEDGEKGTDDDYFKTYRY